MKLAKSFLVFAMHQFVGTWGAAISAYILVVSVFQLPVYIGRLPSVDYASRILAGTPYYPVQIAVGLYFGWMLGRRFQHRSMVWVWVPPLAILSYAVVTGFVLIPEWTSLLIRPGFGQSRWSYYFGWGCRPALHCLDQFEITMPVYVSVAYSLGGLIAQRTLKIRVARD